MSIDHCINTEQPVYSVTEFNHEVKNLLEKQYFNILLEGEISNFVCHRSGHWYFSLKDDNAQIQCAMFRQHNSRTQLMPENGDHVLAQAKASIYPERGNYQLIIQRLENIGEGILQKRYELLKEKLHQEGLFAEELKKPLPKFPQTIGVITSEKGAAIKDIISVLNRRYPLAKIMLYDCLVQGEQAPESIMRALKSAQENTQLDVLILARGGGSLEDLWAFNNEALARAVFACHLPIITGIGHEIDFTICDFVADKRAATPSAAAETATPDQAEIKILLANYQDKLRSVVSTYMIKLQDYVTLLNQKLITHDPKAIIEQQQQTVNFLADKLTALGKNQLIRQQNIIANLAGKLDSLSPLAVLQRGYAVVSKDTQVVNSIDLLTVGDTINAKIADGDLDCTVLAIKPEKL